nr:MAG TPA: hypothetical protein [Caudoviricetes sp.]
MVCLADHTPHYENISQKCLGRRWRIEFGRA